MSPKFVLILYYLLPVAVLGQTVAAPNNTRTESVPVGLGNYSDNNIVTSGRLHFPTARYIIYDSFERDSEFPTSDGVAWQGGDGFPHFGNDYAQPLAWEETFGQPVYSEPISLKGMIRRDGNRMGASATGGLVYTGSDDVFAYAHYGRTGKLIWRTSPSPITNNMMATRWSLANFNIFRRASEPSISEQLR